MIKKVSNDLYRITGNHKNSSFIIQFFRKKHFRQLYYYRHYNESKSKLCKMGYRFLFHMVAIRTTVELPLTARIGEGLLILHPCGITFNSKSVVGKNCTILKGATIGSTKDDLGNNLVPVIGNNVYIGVNSTIVGNIKIGNNVLIAANSFVNFDVPDDSIVIGNPGVIHHKEKASEKYTINPID